MIHFYTRNFETFQFHAVSHTRRISSGNLVLRLSIPHFSLNSERHCMLSGGTLTSTSDRENKNTKHFISSSGDQNYNLSFLQPHTCAPTPRLASLYKTTIFPLIIAFAKNILLQSNKYEQFASPNQYIPIIINTSYIISAITL